MKFAIKLGNDLVAADEEVGWTLLKNEAAALTYTQGKTRIKLMAEELGMEESEFTLEPLDSRPTFTNTSAAPTPAPSLDKSLPAVIKSGDGRLAAGEVVRYEGALWRVGLVNSSRARLDRITGVTMVSPISGRTFQSFSASVNISPTSSLEQVGEDSLTAAELSRVARLVEQEIEMAVAAAPGVEAAKGLKEQNKARMAKLNEAKAQKAADKAAGVATVKAEKKSNPCKCGCGGLTTGFFVPGHDARFKSWMLKIERGLAKPEDVLTPEVRGAYKWVKTAKGLRTTTDYRGQPHAGYDKAAAEATT